MKDFHPLYWIWMNKLPILAALMTLVTAGVKTAPPPGHPFNLYEWAYDWTHQVFNITNTRLNPAPILTPPASTPSATPPIPVKTGIEREQEPEHGSTHARI